jgi:cytochrome c556
MLRTTLTRMDDLDAALSAETVDAGAAAAAAGRVNEACEACHAVYREQDPATKAYRLKPGLIR